MTTRCHVCVHKPNLPQGQRLNKGLDSEQSLFHNLAWKMDTSTTSNRVLRNPSILDEVIWLVHRGGCEVCAHWYPEIDANRSLFRAQCFRDQTHHMDLSNCTLVSKLWAEIAVKHLWGYYASQGNLVSLAANVPQKRLWLIEYYVMNHFKVRIPC